jgi:hypothetical protein
MSCYCTVASCIAFTHDLRLSGLMFSALLSTPLSDLYPATVLVFMALDTALLMCVKILLLYFYWFPRMARGRPTPGPLAALPLKGGQT